MFADLPPELQNTAEMQHTRRKRSQLANSPQPAPSSAIVRRRPLTRASDLRVRRGLFWRRSRAELRGSVLLLDGIAHEVSSAKRVRAKTIIVGVRGSRSLALRASSEPDAVEWVKALALAAAAPPTVTDFEVVSPIGRGGGGEVFLVRDRTAQRALRAMKVVRKYNAFYSKFALRHAMDERLVLELARDCPFIVSLEHAFQDDDALFHVIEFCAGGDLKGRLRRSPRGRLNEDEARRIFAQIILALEHLHSLNVIFRDLKPENVLLTARGDVRLCDFGLSKVLTTGRFGRTNSFCGTTAYMAPEVVSRKHYGIAVDLWGIGALFYRVLVGRAPFDDMRRDVVNLDNNPTEVYKRIQLDDVIIPSRLSKDARDMLEGLLRKQETERWNLEELKECSFFEGIDWDEVLEMGQSRKLIPEEPLTMENATMNFDVDDLKNLRVMGDRKIQVSDATPPKRAMSRLSALGLAMRSKPNPTSIVGFGFSFASDASVALPDAPIARTSAGRRPAQF